MIITTYSTGWVVCMNKKFIYKEDIKSHWESQINSMFAEH